MSELFGWDLIYKVSENDLRKKEDVLTLFVHYMLIKSGYKCIGLGEDKVLTGNEVTTETLPCEWNKSSNYSIRYVNGSNLYILKGIRVDENVVYNLVCVSDIKVTHVAFSIDNTVCATKGNLSTLIPSYDEVMKKIQNELIGPMGNWNTKEKTTQASSSQQSRPNCSNPYILDQPVRPPMYIGPAGPARPDTNWSDPERDPLRVGHSDLDPFSHGGGMIFNPFGSRPPAGLIDPSAGLPGPPLPRGAVPPGARFDPFGPPVGPPRPRRPPDSDEFPPPGFDDMFM